MKQVPSMTGDMIDKVDHEVVGEDEFVKAQKELSSEYKRVKYIREHFKYIPPSWPVQAGLGHHVILDTTIWWRCNRKETVWGQCQMLIMRSVIGQLDEGVKRSGDKLVEKQKQQLVEAKEGGLQLENNKELKLVK